jgi:hypothetical protein
MPRSRPRHGWSAARPSARCRRINSSRRSSRSRTASPKTSRTKWRREAQFRLADDLNPHVIRPVGLVSDDPPAPASLHPDEHMGVDRRRLAAPVENRHPARHEHVEAWARPERCGLATFVPFLRRPDRNDVAVPVPCRRERDFASFHPRGSVVVRVVSLAPCEYEQGCHGEAAHFDGLYGTPLKETSLGRYVVYVTFQCPRDLASHMNASSFTRTFPREGPPSTGRASASVVRATFRHGPARGDGACGHFSRSFADPTETTAPGVSSFPRAARFASAFASSS